MKYVRVTKENIGEEHICCAISNNSDIQASSKKEWMKSCFKDGLVFLKSVERGKCFIEYVPLIEEVAKKNKIKFKAIKLKKKKLKVLQHQRQLMHYFIMASM